MGGTSVEYLTKRLQQGGHFDLLAAVECRELSTYAAAEAAGIIRRPPVSGGGSENQAKRRHWAVVRATGKAPPLALRPEPRPSTLPDLAAALAEWEAAQRPKPRDRKPKPKPAPATVPPEPEPLERTPFPVHPAVPCTNCGHPQAVAAMREIVDRFVAACRGEPQVGSTLPHACCQHQLRCPDVEALIA